MNKRIFYIITLVLFSLQLLAQDLTFEKQSERTKHIGEKYFSYYISMDWENLEKLLSDSSSFEDPTAQSVFGGVMKNGKAEMMKSFREDYSSIEGMKFSRVQTFYSGNHAIFEGVLDWTYVLGNGKKVRTIMQIITILRIEGEFVIEHKDYADYHPFLEEYRKVNSEN